MSTKRIIFCIAIAIVSLPGCKTYYLTPASLQEQLLTTAPAETRSISPFGQVLTYQAVQLNTIRCTDKKGVAIELAVAPNIEMRITQASGKRRSMYFDRTELRGDTLIGHPSWIIPTLTYEIPISSITKVEVQNGGKRLRSAP
ncbi:MAG: hypothetical protein IPN44_01800 [Flavobacteriales bacterium]|nr:hypothetical protein [Flavobacteriales bacterium]